MHSGWVRRDEGGLISLLDMDDCHGVYLQVVKWDEISTVFPVLNSSKRQYGKTKIIIYNKLYKLKTT